MKKKLAIALGTAAAAAIALPAFADHTMSGYFRSYGEVSQVDRNSDDGNAQRYAATRLRARWQNNLNEFVSAVWFGEVDALWGGPGGAQGTDGVNVETKHAYLDLKIPGAPLALATRVGLQPFSDQGVFNGVLMDDDMAGVKFEGKNDMLSATAGWFKLTEGDPLDNDDSDLYAVQVGLKPIPGLTVSPQLFYARNELTADEEDKRDEFYLGAGAGYKLAPLDLSGWFLYDFGQQTDNAGDDSDIGGWAVSAKASAELAGAKAGLRLMYFSKSSDDTDRTWFQPPNMQNGPAEMGDENLMFFLFDAPAIQARSNNRYALVDAAYAGYGLIGAVLTGSFAPPAVKEVSVKGGIGYFRALDDEPEQAAAREGKTLGTEVAAHATYRVAEKADVTLSAAYAFLGNFYDRAAGDPDNLYKLRLMLNVPY